MLYLKNMLYPDAIHLGRGGEQFMYLPSENTIINWGDEY